MNNVMQVSLTAAAVSLAVTQFIMVLQLQRLNGKMEFLAGSSTKRFNKLGVTHSARLGEETEAGYAIYVYRSGKWHLDCDMSKPGYQTTAPQIEGSYEGQVVKRESQPKQA